MSSWCQRDSVADVLADQYDQPSDMLRSESPRPETDHAPTGQTRFEVFFQVGSESRPAVVAAVDVDAALDLDERAGRKVGEIGASATVRMEAEFLFQGRPVQ